MNHQTLDIYEYENLLLGNGERIHKYFEGKSSREQKQIVGNIWNYAITHLLKWTPQEALTYMTTDLVNMLCLDKTIVYLGINPSKYYIGSDYRFVLQYAFPDVISYNFKDETLSDYKRVVKQGIWQNDKVEYRFPKNFFYGEEGIQRASIIMNYICDTYLASMNLRERYEFFADKPNAIKWLIDKGLENVLTQIYPTPLDYFYNSQIHTSQNDFYYYSNLLNQEYITRTTSKKRRKSKMP